MRNSLHVTEAVAYQFVNGELDDNAASNVVVHLLSGCSACQLQMQHAFGLNAAKNANPASTEARFDRALAAVAGHADALEQERRETPAVAAELFGIERQRWALHARNRPRFQNWALVEHLLQMSWECRYDSHADMVQLAEGAVLIAEAIPEVKYGRESVHDLRGRAHAYLANAWSASHELSKASESFQTAKRHLAAGTGDRLERGILLIFETTLLLRQDRVDAALDTAERAISLLEGLDQPALLGRAIAAKGSVLGQKEDYCRAGDCFSRSIQLLQDHSDRRLLLACRHNLAVCYHEQERLEDAMEELEAALPLFSELGDRLNLYRLMRFQGDIARACKDYALAEARLLEARDGLLENNVDWEAAEASLRLAQVYLLQGKLGACRELAEQLMPIFQSRDLHTEAIAAMLLVREAMLTETVTVHMIQETIDFLQRVRPAR